MTSNVIVNIIGVKALAGVHDTFIKYKAVNVSIGTIYEYKFNTTVVKFAEGVTKSSK